MDKTNTLVVDTALSNLKNRLITNYDLTKFEYDVKDVKQKSYIDFICKRNLAYNAAKNNNIKDFIVRYNNFIAIIPSLADRVTKQYYKITMLVKNEHFFEFIYKTLIQDNDNGARSKNNSFLPENIRISMLENYLFNHYNFHHDDIGELNAMAHLTNALLLAASSNGFTDKEIKAINDIITFIVNKTIASPTKTAIEDLIKQNKHISNETKNSIINHKIVVTANPALSYEQLH